MKWCGPRICTRVAFRTSLSRKLSQRTEIFARPCLPEKTVLFPRFASEFLCKEPGGFAVMAFLRVLLLRLHVDSARLDGAQFVAANPPVEDFLSAGCGIEFPPSFVLHQRDRIGPLLVAN